MHKTVSKELCLVCNQNHFEKLSMFYSRLNPRLFHNIAICTCCGHIQHYPLFTESEYLKINALFFGTKYMANNQANALNNNRKQVALDARLSQYLKKHQNVLDVGAGEAWAMDYFHHKRCHYFAIEAVNKLSDSMQERGGMVIGESIFSDYSRYSNMFDVVIFRHILEHQWTPLEALKSLKKLLSPDGKIYVSLPNAANPDIRKGFRASYIRPVHISYFCDANVIRLAHDAGLEPLVCEAHDEIYCLLTHAKPGRSHSNWANHYASQKRIFENKMKEAFVRDMAHIIKDPLKLAIKKITN